MLGQRSRACYSLHQSRRFRTKRCCFLLILVSTLLVGLLCVMPLSVAHAATFDDVNTEPELKSAINDANSNSEADTITISADITLTGALPDITSTITIEGGGHSIDGDGNYRVLSIGSDGDLTLQNITLTKGYADPSGGGVYNEGTLTITGSEISGNSAKGWGGGIYNLGTLTVDNTTISDNSANRMYGGGVYNVLEATVTNSTISGNTAYGYGGGVYNEGTLHITDSTVSDNTSSEKDGGGVCNEGTLTITGSEIVSNSADDRGGGVVNAGTLHITHTTIASNTVTASPYTPSHGGGVSNYGTLHITDSTISDNTLGYGSHSDSGGGGVFNNNYQEGALITVTRSTISGNSAPYGGAVCNMNGTATITDSMLSDNSAQYGGGTYNEGSLTVTNSTIFGNEAFKDTHGSNTGLGGGVLNRSGTFTLKNSTVSGNSAGHGGGVYNDSTFEVIFSTIYGNTAEWRGGGVYNLATAILRQTMVCGNAADYEANEVYNYSGSVYADAYNLFGHGGEDDAGAFGGTFTPTVPSDINATSDGTNVPLAGILDTTLADNGGETKTHALVPGSPAFDTIPNAQCDVSTDQRGVTRPQGDGCDIGAFESNTGHIVVKKKVEQADSDQSFTFNPSWSSDFSLKHGQSKDSGALVPGVYSVSEMLPAGWDLSNLACSSDLGTSSIDSSSLPTVAITLVGGDTVTCTFTNTLQPLPSPSELEVPVCPGGEIVLTWTDNSSSEDGFKIERKEQGASYTQIDTVSADTSTYCDTQLDSGTTYCYRVCAYNAVRDSDYSNEACTTTTAATTALEQISHGPNPVRADGCVFWLNLPDDAVSAILRLFDIDGAELTSMAVDPVADRHPTTGRWLPQDDQGRLLGTGLYLYIIEVEHADGSISYSAVEKMVIKK